MPVFPEEGSGSSTRDRTVQPADLLAHSGLPVPQMSPRVAIEDFNADMSRLVIRIQRLFALLAPTSQGAEQSPSLRIVPHHEQHELGGGDEIDISGLSGQLPDDQPAAPHDIQGTKHTAIGLTAGHVLRATAPTTFAFAALELTDVPLSLRRRAIRYELRKAEVATGEKSVDFAFDKAQVLAWSVGSDFAGGSIQFDLWRANGTVPSSGAQSMVGAGNKPKLVTQDLRVEAVAGWTSDVLLPNDVVVLNVDSVSGGLGGGGHIVTVGILVELIP